MADYSTLQNDVLVALQSNAALQKVQFFAVKDADILSQINAALGSVGASCSISKVFLRGVDPDANPIAALIEMRFEVKLKPAINNSAAGTGLTAEQIEMFVIQALVGWSAVGSMSGCFFCAPDPSMPAVYPDKGHEGRLLRLQARFVGAPAATTVTPIISGTHTAVTITVGAPDAAAPVLYTTDDSCPGYVQGTTTPAGTSTLYTVPFATTAGAPVRAVAIAAGKIPSSVNWLQAT